MSTNAWADVLVDRSVGSGVRFYQSKVMVDFFYDICTNFRLIMFTHCRTVASVKKRTSLLLH